MVNAQEWLDKNYPQENRKNIKEIKVKKMSTSELSALLAGREQWVSLFEEEEKKLEGSLELNDFPNLERLYVPDNKLTSLDCSNNFKLKVLNCSCNKLTELKVNSCLELKYLNCSNNFLTNLVTKYNYELEELNISNNNFQTQDLSFLSHLVNLKVLKIGNNKETRVKGSIYNRFKSSLQPLSNLTQLEELNISNTNFSSGLEYLPSKLEKIWCWSSLDNVDWAVEGIEKKLENYVFYSETTIDLIIQSRGRSGREGREMQRDFPYRYQSWRKDNYELIISAWQKRATELEAKLQMEREEAAKALEKSQEWRERQLKEITEQKDREIEKLQTENARLQAQLEELQLQSPNSSFSEVRGLVK